MKINEILGEQDPAQGTQQFRKYLKQELSKLNMQPTGRQHPDIRFPLKGNFRDFQLFFKNMGVDIQDTTHSESGTFQTYELKRTVPVDGNSVDGEEPVQWSMYYVNNITGTAESTHKFGTKQLTPLDLGVTGQAINKETLLKTVMATLKTKHSEHAPLLASMLSKVAASSEGSISLSELDLSKYAAKDLAVISKNYGEVLAGVWAYNNMEFDSVTFPTASNLKLIDFFGNEDYPVSVKSGDGGKVTIQNILDALQDKIKSGNVNVEEQKSYNVFKIVNNNTMKKGWIELHRYFETKPFEMLAKMMNVGVADITLQTLVDWLETMSLDELETELKPFLALMNTRITPDVWATGEKLRFIISPMGRWMVNYLNEVTEIRESMSDLASMLSVVQVNVDVSQSAINIRQKPFGDAEFIFGWADYKGGNKLGFKMKL